MDSDRKWTIYIAQDKHLDYNWCGTNTEIEVRMAKVVEYYLDQAERYGGKWNLDCTFWLDAYRRHRGQAGADRLLAAVRDGKFGYAANHSVLLWGLLSTELAVRACYGASQIEGETSAPASTALVMENWGILWGAATVLTEAGVTRLARGVYNLRAEQYCTQRHRHPLFWWEAPNGRRLLVHWPLFTESRSWGGYAEAFQLAAMADEVWDAHNVKSYGDRNTPEVFRKRCEYIRQTVDRYESLGEEYPVSQIMLLGTGYDNWTLTPDYRLFIERYNAESDGRIRLVDARYDEFFAAVEDELGIKKLSLPTVKGSFGITWEEWPAHLASLMRDFRQADRLVRLAEAREALGGIGDVYRMDPHQMIRFAHDALFRFAEHDMGGCRRRYAAVSAGVRAAAATQALDIGRCLAPRGPLDKAGRSPAWRPLDDGEPLPWRGGQVCIDLPRLAVASIRNEQAVGLFGEGPGLHMGELLVTRYDDKEQTERVFPDVKPLDRNAKTDFALASETTDGVAVRLEGVAWGFGLRADWLFYSDQPWIDLTYTLTDGWDEGARTVQVCFPSMLARPTYRYDTAGAILKAGPKAEGGDDLPGANPELFAAQTFASAESNGSHMLLLTPDAHLVQFGPSAIRTPGCDASGVTCLITSMPMMNLTRHDHQLGQAGRNEWTFRYRLVLSDQPWEPVRALRQAQQFATAPFPWISGSGSAVAEIDALEIDFASGPLIAIKRPEDGSGLVLRFWNVTDKPARGSIRLPDRMCSAEQCDALERPLNPLPISARRATFAADPLSLATLALR